MSAEEESDLGLPPQVLGGPAPESPSAASGRVRSLVSEAMDQEEPVTTVQQAPPRRSINRPDLRSMPYEPWRRLMDGEERQVGVRNESPTLRENDPSVVMAAEFRDFKAHALSIMSWADRPVLEKLLKDSKVFRKENGEWVQAFYSVSGIRVAEIVLRLTSGAFGGPPAKADTEATLFQKEVERGVDL